MDANLDLDYRSGTRLDVTDLPVTLRLAAGSAIFAVRGEAWITQERLYEDVILAPGERFDVATRLPIVINATRGPAILFVAPPAIARRHAEHDVRDFARRRAEELRAHAQARLTVAAGAGPTHPYALTRTPGARLRPDLAPRRGAFVAGR